MKLVFSSGDTNGIGLECFFKSLPDIDAEKILVCNSSVLLEHSKNIGIDLRINGENAISSYGSFKIHDIDYDPKLSLGSITEESGKHSAISIKTSLDLIDSNDADALITLPINKEAIKLSGWDFPGHTEFIAHRYRVSDYNMILTADKLSLIPLTIHIPLDDVAKNITQELIVKKAKAYQKSLINDFGIKQPKIAILSLNPHAGDGGKIGTEEIYVIQPAIDSISTFVEGPFAADSFFAFRQYKDFDGVISMYHDQGLIPIKMLSEGAGVNYTSGLPIIRTSPDHGTGFSIVAKNIADPLSTINAAKLAVKIYKKRKLNENR